MEGEEGIDARLHFVFLCLLDVTVHAVAVAEPRKTMVKKRADVDCQLIELQQQTLAAVHELADTQRQLLDVEEEKLALKKVRLMSKGVFQDDNGNWVIVHTSKEE